MKIYQNKSKINILYGLLEEANNISFDLPREYLEWFLKKTTDLFTEEELLFMNVQYLFIDDFAGKLIKFNKINYTPAIVNKKNIPEDFLIQRLHGVLTFFYSLGIKGYLSHLVFGLPPGLLKKKFILETILIDNNKQIKKPLVYDSKLNKLRLNVPNLYHPSVFKKYLSDLTEKIKLSFKFYKNDFIIIDGTKFDILVNEIVKKERTLEFILFINNLFKRKDVTEYLNFTKSYFKEHLSKLIKYDNEKDLNLLLEGALLHSFFKGITFSYQIPILSMLKEDEYCDLGAIMLTTKQKLDAETLQIIIIAFEMVIKQLREFNLYKKSKNPGRNVYLTEYLDKNFINGLEKTHLNILSLLRNNSFNISQTTDTLNMNGNRSIRRKTVVRYTKEIFLYFLAKNNFDLERAILQLANSGNNKKIIAKKYKDYFLGHKGILTIITKGKSKEKEIIKNSLRIRYRKYFINFEKYVNENKNTLSEWKEIIEQYLID